MTTFQIICFIFGVILIIASIYFCTICYNARNQQSYSSDLQCPASTQLNGKPLINDESKIKEFQNIQNPNPQTPSTRTNSSCSILIETDGNPLIISSEHLQGNDDKCSDIHIDSVTCIETEKSGGHLTQESDENQLLYETDYIENQPGTCQPDAEVKRQQLAEAAERRQKRQERPSLKDSAAARRTQKREMEMERLEKEARLKGDNGSGGLKWQMY